MILGAVEPLPKATDLAHGVDPGHHTMQHVVVVAKPFRREVGLVERFHSPAVASQEVVVAVGEDRVRSGDQRLAEQSQRGRLDHVVVIEHGHEHATCRVEGGRAGGDDPAVAVVVEYPHPNVPLSGLMQQFADRRVGGSVVDEHVLPVAVRLGADRIKACLQVLGLGLVDRRDHGDQRPV